MTGDQPGRCGTVALAGRPNVGKSTLLNHLLGRKLGITSRKPQTTRHALVGILNRGATQIVFVDTPGIHRAKGRALNRYMVGQAVGSLAGVDLALMLVDCRGWRDGDEVVREHVARADAPCLCVITKIDRLAHKERLLPLIDDLRRRHDFAAIVPVAALKNQGLEALVDAVAERLPAAPPRYGPSEVTNRPAEFLIAEIIREKATRRLGAELPHQATVVVERIAEGDGCVDVHAVVFVERETQKRIAIGHRGAMLKSIGADARKDVEHLLGRKAMLHLWVKVNARWSDRPPALRQLGYL